MATGQQTATKPSRSDDVLGAAQQLQIYNQVRAKFDSMAPKRPIKPNRSDPDSISISSPHKEDIHIPELQNLRSLQDQSQAIIYSEATELDQEEFVETEYYRALDSIDKKHHTTGSGFIKVAVDHKNGDGYDLQVHGSHRINGREMVFKTNPARNDWIPKFDNSQVQQ